MASLLGSKAPDFNLKTSEGKEFAFSSLDGQWKILFFYAEDGSPVCKRGCLSFKDHYNLFRTLEPPVEVIGISRDSVEQHRQFKEELDLPFVLLSDPDRKVATSFGVPLHLGSFPAKSSFLIGPDNTVHHVYDWHFRPRKHVATILDTVSNMNRGG